jgi:putative salt-induced outer membrane protein YdiY
VRSKLVVALLVLMTIPAFADQVILKNGDKLTGTIAKSDGKTLVLKTDYAGDLTIKFDDIQSMTSTGDLNVTAGGKTAVGPVTTSADKLVVATKTGGSVEAPIASVTILRSPAEEAAYQKSLHPGFGEGWAGGANLGFALTAGNSETKNLNIGLNATRTGFHDKLTLSETTVYATTTNNKVTPITSTTTANSNDGSIRYDRDIVPRVFAFVSGDFFNNSLQDLDLRYILGGGIGFHAIKTPTTTLDLLAGINYTHESFSGLTSSTPPPPTYSHSDSSAALTVGDNFTHKIGKNSMFTQSFLLYPSFSQVNINPSGFTTVGSKTFTNPDNVRILRGAFNLGFNTKLYKWLGWQATFNDVFDNHPIISSPLIERNDITLATGLSFSFTH